MMTARSSAPPATLHRTLDETQGGSLADTAARNTAIAGVVLPDLIHGEVVRDRLALLGVTL